MRWTHTPLPAVEVEALSKRAGVSRVLAELLLRAGLRDGDAAAAFLQPALAGLNDPFLLRNLEAAATRLRQAIAQREQIVVLGDYDVDGVSSTALLVMILRRFGLNPRFVVPRRSEDGYGLSRSAIDRALEGGKPDLFIALDCGTNSHIEAAYLRSLGVDVMVIDHHRSKEEALDQCLLINPHVHSCALNSDGAWRNLCTVGLVFKLCHGLLKQLRAENHPVAFRIKLRDHLDLVALGTVADLVPLIGENRISGTIVDAAIEVHRTLGGPGLLESIYREALAVELLKRGLEVQREKEVPIMYKGARLNDPLRLDLLVENCVIV
jgi:single-stranded-DNA-specific exonuclease